MNRLFSSFRLRLVTVILLLLLATQGATFFLVASAAENNARAQIEDEIEGATRIFEQLAGERVQELELAVRLLNSDYAFSSTFAKLREHDDPVARATLRSALQNYSLRIVTASFLRLISLDGELMADTLPPHMAGDLVLDEKLLQAADDSPDLKVTTVERIRDTLHLIVIQPLLMPEPSAWIAVGFPLDDARAAELGELSDFEVGFIHKGQVVGSTEALKRADSISYGLSRNAGKRGDLLTVVIGGKRYLGKKAQLSADYGKNTEVVMLRSLERELAPFQRLQRTLLVLNVLALGVSGLGAILLGSSVTRPVMELAMGVERIEQGDFRARVAVKSRDELGRLASAFNKMVLGLQERDKVRDLLGKVVSPQIAHELVGSRVEVEGELREATILFTDLRGFTAFSETQSPQALLQQLNAYFTEVTGAVEAAGGVVDKYIGDALMAIFGAPATLRDHADRAVAAALAILQAEEKLNRKRAAQGLLPLRTGIGISSGVMVAGNIGSSSRYNYTVIGNDVNLASRLESLTKETRFKARIICSDATREALQHSWPLRDLGESEIRGKEFRTRIWAVDYDSASPMKNTQHEAGLHAYSKKGQAV
ncbi:MAG TPA: adenylate/guanylate cyclase domain-containing protein [Chthoniobacterales bacterium]